LVDSSSATQELAKKLRPAPEAPWPFSDARLATDCRREPLTNVCFWHLADIPPSLTNVRFWGQSGHDANRPLCRLMTQSRHWRVRCSAQPNFAKAIRTTLLIVTVRGTKMATVRGPPIDVWPSSASENGALALRRCRL